MPKLLPCLAAALLVNSALADSSETIKFCGYEWTVRDDHGLSEPGPNLWDPHNVWLDEHGWLHLKISRSADGWHCAEVYLTQNLGFGRYQWDIAGPLNQLDPQMVLGLFNYTRPEVGPDGTNEIDIEFARWGNPVHPPGNFTVWPAVKTVKEGTYPFEFKLDGNYTTSQFDWSSKGVTFRMLASDAHVLSQWAYAPSTPEKYVPQQPLPLHINFWLCDGKPPQNNQGAEVIIRKFTFTPQPSK